MRDVEGTTGDESDAALRVGRLVLVQEVEAVALELIVADVTVTDVSLKTSSGGLPLAGKEKHVVTLGEVRDDDTRTRVKALCVEVGEVSRVPE